MKKMYKEGDLIPDKYCSYIDPGKMGFLEIEECMFGFTMKTNLATIRVWTKKNPRTVGNKNGK